MKSERTSEKGRRETRIFFDGLLEPVSSPELLSLKQLFSLTRSLAAREERRANRRLQRQDGRRVSRLARLRKRRREREEKRREGEESKRARNATQSPSSFFPSLFSSLLSKQRQLQWKLTALLGRETATTRTTITPTLEMP